jgi:hypothetical protein
MDWQRSGPDRGLGCPWHPDGWALAISGPTLCHLLLQGCLRAAVEIVAGPNGDPLGFSGLQECFLALHPFVPVVSRATPNPRRRQETTVPSSSLNRILWARGGDKGARRVASSATVGVSAGWAPC